MITKKCDICNKEFEGHTIKEVENQYKIHKVTQHED